MFPTRTDDFSESKKESDRKAAQERARELFVGRRWQTRKTVRRTQPLRSWDLGNDGIFAGKDQCAGFAACEGDKKARSDETYTSSAKRLVPSSSPQIARILEMGRL